MPEEQFPRPHGFPERVRVGAHSYELVYDRAAILEERCEIQDNRLEALCNYPKLRMTFDPAIAPSMTRENVLHEVLHAVCHQAGEYFQSEKQERSCEDFIGLVTPVLGQVLHDNGDLSAFLCPSLRAQIEHQQSLLSTLGEQAKTLTGDVARLGDERDELRAALSDANEVIFDLRTGQLPDPFVDDPQPDEFFPMLPLVDPDMRAAFQQEPEGGEEA